MRLVTVKGKKPVTMIMSNEEYNRYKKRKNRLKILSSKHYTQKQLAKLRRYTQ